MGCLSCLVAPAALPRYSSQRGFQPRRSVVAGGSEGNGDSRASSMLKSFLFSIPLTATDRRHRCKQASVSRSTLNQRRSEGLGERRVNASMRNSATSSPSDSLPARKGFPARFSRSRVQRPRSSGFRHHRYANLPLQLVATAIGNPLMWVNMSSSYAAAHGRTRDTTRAESSQMSFSRRRNAASRRKFEGEFSSFFFYLLLQ